MIDLLRLGVRALLCAGILPFAVALAADPPDTANVAAATVTICRALSAAGPGERFPADAPSSVVALPDEWAATRPGYEGSVWYRAAFRLDGALPSDQLMAVYVERACTNLQVQLNGFLVFRGGRMSEPVSRHCAQAQLVALPTALVRAGENVLELRVQGHAQQHVGSVQAAGGLSAATLGYQATLAREHAAELFWGPSWLQAATIVLVGLGCVMVSVGWLNPREVYFSYFGWLCLGWVAASLAAASTELPWRNGVTEFLLASSWPVLLAVAVQFLLSFAGLRSRKIENVVALQWVAVPLSLVLAGPEHLFAIANAWYLVLGLELMAVAAIYLFVTLRQRPQDFGPMALVIAAGFACLVVELAVQQRLIAAPVLSMGRLVVPVLLIAVGTRLFLMFAKALHATESDRDRLARQLRTLSRELDARVEQMTAQRVEIFTQSERKRIARDLHDDLGAKLLTIVHTTDSSHIPQLAREALEEMRLAVRGLAGKPVRLAEAMADWRAETVSRLGQAKIAADWSHFEEESARMLPSRVFMQMTRILREAISNVIKHSAASRCEVDCRIVDETLRLTVSDDGRGIVVDLHRGQGMSSMKRRAKKMEGQCLVESRPGHGVVISLTVPL